MRGGTPPPSAAGASGGHICEDAPVFCCIDKSENISENNDNVNTNPTPNFKRSWREIKKETVQIKY